MRTGWALFAGVVGTGWMMASATPARAEEPAKPAAAPASAEEDEGPFAPKGRTGKLKKTEAKEAAEAPEIEHEKPAGNVGLDVVFGFGKKVEAATTSDASSISFVLGGSYRLTPELSLGLRVPFTSGSVKLEGQDASQKGTALGNIELEAGYHAKLGAHTELPIELGIAVPTAAGDAFSTDPGKQRAAAVNEVAAQSRAFEDDALFSPHRFGLVPRIGIEHEKEGVELGAYTKAELLFKAGGEALPAELSDTVKQNSLAAVWVTGGEAFYYVWGERIGIGTRAWLAVLAKEAVEVVQKTAQDETPSKVQAALEPTIRGHFGRLRAGIGYIAPLGGQLGGNIAGLRLGVGAQF